ncbi:MAG: hypothetical protein AAF447_19385 [Myxococcota bacterium]
MAELRISQDKPTLADLEEALESCVAQLEDLYQEREHEERERAGRSADVALMAESLDAQVRVLIEERSDIRREIDLRRADIRSFARHVRRVMDEVAEHAIAFH